MIEFLPLAFIGVFAGFIGSMFESVGDYAATCSACNEKFHVKHIDRGIMAEGFGCAATAFSAVFLVLLTPKILALSPQQVFAHAL